MERHKYESNDGFEYKQHGRCIVDHAKTNAGSRRLYLVKEAREIVDIILKVHHDNGYKRDFFLFMKNGKPVTDGMIRWRLVTYCKNLSIEYRSLHKIRKTYISKLIDEDVNINTIRELVGHEDERTTYKCYCFSRRTKEQTQSQLEKALMLGKEYSIGNVVEFIPKTPDFSEVIKGNQKNIV